MEKYKIIPRGVPQLLREKAKLKSKEFMILAKVKHDVIAF